jgi:hypothetical protein
LKRKKYTEIDLLGFIVNMFLSEDEIKFEPSITDFETVFLSMYDLIIAKCSNLPRIEAKLFSDRAVVCKKKFIFFFDENFLYLESC